MLFAALKQQTKIYHDKLDHKLDIFNRITSPEAYCQLLSRFLGFYSPIEQSLAQIPDLQILDLNMAGRRKASWLQDDLRVLGIEDTDALTVCQNMPQLSNAAQALGCMYVLEGATLGGQLIRRHVEQTLGFTAIHGIAFFSSYGAQVGPMWKSFCSIATEYAENGADPEVIPEIVIGAACDTFVKIEQWLTEAIAQ